MNINELLNKLSELSISIKSVSNELEINAPKGALTAEVIAEIKKYKSEIIHLLNDAKNFSTDSQIPSLKRQEYYDLSASQRRIWMIDQIQGKSPEFLMSLDYHTKEKIDKDIIKTTLSYLIKRHESLRTSFEVIDGEPKQKIHDEASIPIKWVDLKAEKNKEDAFKKYYKAEFEKGFDLKKGSLFRVIIFEKSNNESSFIYLMHHIISDGSSLLLLNNEILTVYQCLKLGKQPDLQPLDIQYKDFAAWQNKRLETSNDRNFWIKELKGDLPILSLPYDGILGSDTSKLGESYRFYIDKKLRSELIRVSREKHISLYMLLLAAFNIVLSRISGQNDILIGSPVAGRENEAVENLIGCFINTVILRNTVKEEDLFDNFLVNVRKRNLEALEHQSYPFEELINHLEVKRDITKYPLTSIFFNMMNYDDYDREAFETKEEGVLDKVVKFDLNCYISNIIDDTLVQVDYRRDLFNPETIELIFNKYQEILRSIAEDPSQKIKDIRDSQQSTDTIEPVLDMLWYKEDETIVSVFEKVAENFGAKLAVKSGDKEYRYQELDEESNRWARELEKSNADYVALFINHDEKIPLAILSVLKAGKAYVPLDTSDPEERIKKLIEQSGCDLILSDEANLKNLEAMNLDLRLLNIDDQEEIEEHSSEKLEIKLKPEDPAYILFTSGSTGEAKGVVQTHKSVLHFVSQYSSFMEIKEDDRLSGLFTYHHDSSTSDIFASLLNGASYHPLAVKYGLSLEEIQNRIKDDELTIYHSSPAVFRLISENQVFPSLKKVKMAGETVKRSDFDVFKESSRKEASFIVSYGSTESTLAMMKELRHDDPMNRSTIPAGHRLARTEISIRNTEGVTLSDLEQGEIYIHSDFLTTGYLKNNKESKRKFIIEEKKRWYRTGDIGRRLASGDYEILGRVDGQIKLRGNRIELSEIENHLLSFPEVKSAHVSIKEENNEDYLAAYLSGKEDIDIKEIRRKLSKRVADYMIPDAFLIMENLPLTASGKVDRKSLPEIEIGQSSDNYVAASTETEKTLTKIWEDVLGKEEIGIRDNFFELGGHSLKAMQVISRINKELSVELGIKTVFESSEIEGLARIIDERDREEQLEIEVVEREAYYDVSHAQRRLWILDQLDEESSAYNMPGSYILKGKLEHEAFKEAFESLVNRHESLRTRFISVDGIPKQVIEDLEFKIDYIDLSEEENPEEKAKGFAREETEKPFDLEKAPLLRAKLIYLEEEKHVFLFTMHHIISDGWSMGVLVNEVLSTYNEILNGVERAEKSLRIQYKDYSAWQNKVLESEKAEKSKAYWLEVFKEEIEAINLATDYPRPNEQSNEGDHYHFSFDKELSEALNDYAAENKASLFMVLLSGFYGILSRYSGQRDIVIGSPIAGRNHQDLEELIGFFVNNLAIRIKTKNDTSFKDLLNIVKNKTLLSYGNQDYPFDKLVEDLGVEKDLSRSPLFDVMFTLQNKLDQSTRTSFENISVDRFSNENNTSKYDLTLTGTETFDQIHFTIEYCTRLFKEETIKQFSEHFQRYLREGIKNENDRYLAIDILSEEEKNKLLIDFNQTDIEYNSDKTVIELFEEQVIKTPNNNAIIYEEKVLTYKELNEEANKIAHYLIQHFNIKKDSRIGLILDRNEKMIISILAVLKTGAAYVPIDPDYPLERKEYMIDDSESIAILTDQKTIAKYETITVSICELNFETESKNNIDLRRKGSDLIYIIYTSGSTGKPKGVMIEHKSVVRLVNDTNYISVNETDRFLQLSNYAFDGSIFDIFGSLLNGASLYLINKESIVDFNLLKAKILKNKINISFITTALFNNLIDLDATLIKQFDKIYFGGEECSVETVRKALEHRKNEDSIVHVYGPTETTTFASFYPVKQLDHTAFTVAIGKPISNAKLYVLDKELNLQAIGVLGELYIAGSGLARGYLNQEELTKEKFVKNPFGNGFLYRTGDIVKLDREGNIYFSGRVDNQVKIRGHRIEIAEIENQFLSYGAVEKAVVVVKGKKQKNLVAYLKLCEGENVEEILSKLKSDIPSYMIPSYVHVVEEMPLTSNGKVDRKKLSELFKDEDITESEYVSPKTLTEKTLVKIWEETLEKNKVGINDSFFELGGHSLKAMQLINKASQQFKIELKVKLIFRFLTIKAIASEIDKVIALTSINNDYHIPPLGRQEYYDLSASQRRIWMIDQIQESSDEYLMTLEHEVYEKTRS